jgi:helix-turn-helix protein
LLLSASASALAPPSPIWFSATANKFVTSATLHKKRLRTAQIHKHNGLVALERDGQRFDAFVADIVNCNANHGAIATVKSRLDSQMLLTLKFDALDRRVFTKHAGHRFGALNADLAT